MAGLFSGSGRGKKARLFVYDFLSDISIMSGENAINLITNGFITCLKKDTFGYVPIRASAFTVLSSIRYKENIKSITDEEAKKVLELNPVSFDYKDDCGGEKNCFGLIAEETEDIIPFAVSKNKEGQPDSIDYSKFTAHLIKMVQMQQEEIEGLKEKNQELEERLTRLEKRLAR